MTDNARTDHHKLLETTGRRRLTAEQEETINKLMGNLELDLEDEEGSTLDLPQPRVK